MLASYVQNEAALDLLRSKPDSRHRHCETRSTISPACAISVAKTLKNAGSCVSSTCRWFHNGDLPVEGSWLSDGPQLPIEFTRVSGSRCLTLAITEGARPVTVLWSSLSVPSLDDGILALAEREGISQRNIHRSIGVWRTACDSQHAGGQLVSGQKRAT
jgi:hypothetical protein